ncbi:MAG: cation:proton antiporter [Bacilli bacterium]
MFNSFIINLAILLLVGLLFSKIAKLVKFPNVTGYLVGGLLVGPAIPLLLESFGLSLGGFKGIVSSDGLKQIETICDVALAFIAFTIGSEFKLSYFKVVGSRPIVIAIFEALFASIFVFLGSFIIAKSGIVGETIKEQSVAFSLVLASIAAATAPAATLLVVKQYKAKGPLTNTLISVVALDDAAALIIFGFCFTIAANISSTINRPLALSFAMPFIEIIVSLVIGTIIGFIVVGLLRWFHGRSNRICIILAALLATIGINNLINKQFDMNLSNLLSCMMLGACTVNLSNAYDDVAPLVDRFTPPFFMLFFVISGAELNMTTLFSPVFVIALAYIIIRVIGKWFGAWFGSSVSKAEPVVKKYLGPCLIPQAGVAIGLSLIAVNSFPSFGIEIRSIILAATLVYELVGPLVAKVTLKKAGEIETVSRTVHLAN